MIETETRSVTLSRSRGARCRGGASKGHRRICTEDLAGGVEALTGQRLFAARRRYAVGDHAGRHRR